MELSASFTRALLSGFDRAYAELVRAATRSTGSREEAGELVHEAWLRLAVHAQSAKLTTGQVEAPGDQPNDTTAYLAVMTQHMALDAHRRRQRHERYMDGAVLHEQLAPSHTPDVADSVMYRQALAVLETALAGLPERSRNAFVAHRIHGDKQPVIAERLGVSLNTVERDLIQASACVEDALHRWRGNSLVAATARRAGRRRSLAALLSLAGVGVGGHLGWQQWQLYRQQHVQWQANWQSPRGQQVRHALPDGSSLLLDALSQAQLQYFAARRSVQLMQGAAFFDVARDEDRPFEVQAAGLRITVLGTRFGVEITPMGRGPSRVSVQVESGRVRVQPLAQGDAALEGGGGFVETLEAGQALQWSDGDRSPQRALVETAASWRHGELVFTHTSLGQAVERLSRYATFVIKTTPEAARLPLSGRVRIAHAQAWIQALPRALPVQVQQQSDGSLVLSRRSRL